MKNTYKEIIERFQKFDFDPQEINQKQIFNKIIAPAAQRNPKRLAFAFVAIFSVLIAVVLINNKGQVVKSDIDSYEGQLLMSSDIAEQVNQQIAGETAAVESSKDMRFQETDRPAKPAKVFSDAIYSDVKDIRMTESPAPSYDAQYDESEKRAAPMEAARVKSYKIEKKAAKAGSIKKKASDAIYSVEPAACAPATSLARNYDSMQDKSYEKSSDFVPVESPKGFRLEGLRMDPESIRIHSEKDESLMTAEEAEKIDKSTKFSFVKMIEGNESDFLKDFIQMKIFEKVFRGVYDAIRLGTDAREEAHKNVFVTSPNITKDTKFVKYGYISMDEINQIFEYCFYVSYKVIKEKNPQSASEYIDLRNATWNDIKKHIEKNYLKSESEYIDLKNAALNDIKKSYLSR
ncbi:MAG: hypothetical protein FWG57_08725 [Endomicrobia bacterium]|nr:hypothetical protein [Endomicrobiia bacterium]